MGAASSLLTLKTSVLEPCASIVADKKKCCAPHPPIIPPPQNLKDPTATKKIIYIDSNIYWADPKVSVKNAVDAGYNVILFAFYLKAGAWDMALVWQNFSDADKQELLTYANSRGAILGVSCGGATETWYLDDPVALATDISNWVLTNRLQVLDADLENIAPGFTYPGCPDLYDWMNKFFGTARTVLGNEIYISSAPQTPYLSVPGVAGTWPGIKGGFYQVMKDNPSISWLFLQMYNQGANYLTYETCFVDSGRDFPLSAISQLYNQGAGIPYEKMVFGTFLQSTDGQGNNNPNDIHTYLQRAAADYKWQAGAGVWQYSTSGTPSPAQWIQIVFASTTSLKPKLDRALAQIIQEKSAAMTIPKMINHSQARRSRSAYRRQEGKNRPRQS